MSALNPPLRVAVIGAGNCSPELATVAYEVGQRIAQQGWHLVCGGRGGVMAAACEGAQQAGGYTLGILPDNDPRSGNPYLSTAIATGLGEGRNLLVVMNADGVLAIGGAAGTLSEIAYTLYYRKPLVLLHSWHLQPPDAPLDPMPSVVQSPQAAIERLAKLLSSVS
ncbi:TIGR00725 family protein [Leptolyngbya sp. FACHB-261]|uniref:TIGR00725 family protein n=1 Tax=Leptolyngbya sp. FACHB-261 TaxID=2692806 RepID=UPI00168912B2|nr:TIGR00725 family protein [Leptolyngbya sp. FACHB-261]MBD2101236.1 TIGR00725 family protein [Leptolyngbya sp. FACHB-261]